MLGNNLGKEKYNILDTCNDFFYFARSASQYGGVPYHLRALAKPLSLKLSKTCVIFFLITALN